MPLGERQQCGLAGLAGVGCDTAYLDRTKFA